MKILVTGAAGFIGMTTAECLLARGDEVVGLDNLNDYYDVTLKRSRLQRLLAYPRFRFQKMDIVNRSEMDHLFESEGFDLVLHLAAQAGVRYSIQNPHAYVDSNVVGFLNILEGCRHAKVKHLLYASSSSVYGGNTKMPFSEEDCVDYPVSLYAASKKANELMAHTYGHLYGLSTAGLRFFTVYGPWGRPDMALFLFTKAILEGRTIDVFNEGKMLRDFTYVDDIAQSIVRIVDRISAPNPDRDINGAHGSNSKVPYRVLNIGNSNPVSLLDFIACIESAVGKRAQKNWLPLQAGDVPATYANTDALRQWVGIVPTTRIDQGVAHFVKWYRNYYQV